MAARVQKHRLLTTGEAADLLKVSRSTVSRRFDKGELRGEVNRITGERMIRRDSVLGLMRESGLADHAIKAEETVERQIVAATNDQVLTERLERIIGEAEAIHLTATTFGADALIACASLAPDLLVLGDELADITCAGVVSALDRQMGEHRPKILCCCGDPALADQDVDVINDVTRLSDTTLFKRICRLLGMAEQMQEDEPPRRADRRWPRHGVSIPAKVGFYRNHAPRKHFWGKGVIENVSHGGAFLSSIELETDVIPASPFRLIVQADNPPLNNWQAHCQVLRLCSNGVLSAGVRFLKVSKANQAKLAQLAD